MIRTRLIFGVLMTTAAVLLPPAPLLASHAEVFRGVEDEITTKMPDGVELAASLFLPAAGRDAETSDSPGLFPVIFVRTPYGKDQHRSQAEFWAAHGYAVMIQDARGKFRSGGEYLPFVNEMADGLATLDWIVKQPWCNGSIGMWGGSYLGFSQLILAAEGHPGLKSIFPISGWLGSDGLMTIGGANHIQLSIPWILHEESQTKRNLGDYEIDEVLEYLPLFDAFKSIGLDSNIWSEKYEPKDLGRHEPEDIAIPGLHMTGWLDFVHDTALRVYSGAASSEAPQRLVVGPWFHDQYYTTYTEAGDEDFGPNSVMGLEGLMDLSLQWFDLTLKGKATGLSETPRVMLFVMGANEWRGFDQWPPAAVRPHKLYMGSTTGANSSSGDGTLSAEPAGVAASDSFTFDPMDPVPTHGGANMHFMLHLIGVKDQSSIEKRSDVLVYTSEPLAEDMEIIGPIETVLYAATEGRDTDFTAKLVELRANGYARIIEEGIIRASYRGGAERELLEPGQIYRMSIVLGSTAIRVPAGSRLRVEISSSNFPKYDRNPNTGEDPLQAPVLKTVQQLIHHGKDYPSHIVLPVLPAKIDSPKK